MKHLCLIPLVLVIGFVAGCSTTPQEALHLRTRECVVIVSESSNLGAVTNKDYPFLYVEAVRYTSPDVHGVDQGLRIQLYGSTAYLPLHDVPKLISAIDRISVVQGGPPPFNNYSASYKIDGFSLSRSVDKDYDNDKCHFRIDTNSAPCDPDGLQQLKALLIKGEDQLK